MFCFEKTFTSILEHHIVFIIEHRKAWNVSELEERSQIAEIRVCTPLLKETLVRFHLAMSFDLILALTKHTEDGRAEQLQTTYVY